MTLSACIQQPQALKTISPLPSIIAWRPMPANVAYDVVVGGEPAGVFSPVLTVTKWITGLYTFAMVDWLPLKTQILIWRPAADGEESGRIAIYDGRVERDCPNRVFGESISLEMRPSIVSTKQYMVYAQPRIPLGYGKLDLRTCNYEPVTVNQKQFPSGAQDYCAATKQWTSRQFVFDEDINVIGTLSDAIGMKWSPDCKQLLALGFDGWYLIENGRWSEKTRIIERDFSDVRLLHYFLQHQTTDLPSEHQLITPPSWSPDKSAFVYSTYGSHARFANGAESYGTSYIVDIAKRTERILIENAVYPAWQK